MCLPGEIQALHNCILVLVFSRYLIHTHDNTNCELVGCAERPLNVLQVEALLFIPVHQIVTNGLDPPSTPLTTPQDAHHLARLPPVYHQQHGFHHPRHSRQPSECTLHSGRGTGHASLVSAQLTRQELQVELFKADSIRYPEEVADKAWDNVGLLLGNMDEQGQRALGLETTPDEKTVLLTNDLSPGVATEAVRRKASVIVSYRTIAPALFDLPSHHRGGVFLSSLFFFYHVIFI